MRRHVITFIVLVVVARPPLVVFAQAQAPTAADSLFHAVVYVDILPSAARAMTTAFTRYREASRRDDGFVRLELLEQVGRPAHYVVLETWRDPEAFDAHALALHTKQYREALQPIRISGYDERPYKVLKAGGAQPLDEASLHVVSHVDFAGPAAQARAPNLLMQHAEESRRERGNVRFDVLQHTMRGNHFTVVESWQSQRDLDTHAAAAHTKEYREALTPITGSPLDENLYRAVR